MSDIVNQVIFKLFIAGVIGAIVGLEREKNMQVSNEYSPIGIRTDILFGLLGGLSVYLSGLINSWIFIICLLSVIIIGLLPIIQNHTTEKVMSYKTSISAIMVFLLGALAFAGEMKIALTLAILVMFVLSLKYTLRKFIYGISYPEIIDAAKFVIIAFVILPFLPNQAYDSQFMHWLNPAINSHLPTNIINPYNIWFLIVIISGLNLLGYILVKLMGKNRGFGLTGLIGGFYSSTVTSLNLAYVSKSNPDVIYPFVAGILLACGTSFLKMFVLISALNVDLFNRLFPSMIAMCAYLLISGGFFHLLAQRTKKEAKKRSTKTLQDVTSPLKLKIAVKLGSFVVLTMLAANLILQYATIDLYYVLAGAMAFFAVDDPIIVSTASIAGNVITMDIAKNIIIGVIFLNLIQKLATVYVFGNRKLIKPLAIGFGGLFLVTVLSFLYL